MYLFIFRDGFQGLLLRFLKLQLLFLFGHVGSVEQI